MKPEGVVDTPPGSWRRWLDLPPSKETQGALLGELCVLLTPLIATNHLPADFTLRPGLRLRRRFGTCRWSTHGVTSISVRCTAVSQPPQWRTPGAILVTLLHELSHLKYRTHGISFWQLVRRLVDQCHAAGIYDPEESSDEEAAAGDEKLVGSAADGVAVAARRRRRSVWWANRRGLAGWKVGDPAIVPELGRRPALRVEIVALRRTRVEAIDAVGRHYLVPGSLLQVDTQRAYCRI
ncbi:MAG: M48 family metallopeptidase [Chloroflexi bacterium]|nr:M48 family metallopeptidase [Chloroflexota bacterium]